MTRFTRLIAELDRTTRTNEKVDALVRYLRAVDAGDAAWAIHILSGNRPKRLVPVRRLAAWAQEQADVPEWLFDECYSTVGDLAETIALLLPEHEHHTDATLHDWISRFLLALDGQAEDVQRALVVEAWQQLSGFDRFVYNKLITGGFRIGVSRALVVRAIAQVSGVDEPTIAHRLTGNWTPDAAAFTRLMSTTTDDADLSRPYPFFLASPLDGAPDSLGEATAWAAEWKWDGIRAQLVRRAGLSYLWSRGEELITERFPELIESAALLPDGTVLDGEVLPWRDGEPMPFAQLQRRIGRTRVGARILSEVPVILMVYDVLEHDGVDLRARPFSERRALLEALLARLPAGVRFMASPLVSGASWQELTHMQAQARARGAEGLMLKRRDAEYGTGRKRGAWWKWKVAPYTADAVLIYAQAGHGRRAALHTDYTFAVWSGDELVPFAKAYSGLTDAELRKLDAWIRRNTVEKFGPVRSVTPEHVFELAFEGIQESPRHRSGVAVRFPRILRWRTDKRPEDADTIDTLRGLL